MHALTVDLEDYRAIVARDYFGQETAPDPIVCANTARLLQLFADHDVRATFFTLGDVAETYPQLISDIAAAGHELGVHGHHHLQVFKLTPESFRREIEVPKKRIEDLTGRPVLGHRAPAFSIVPRTAWAFDVLADVGFRYDSSVMPLTAPRYGWPGFPQDIHERPISADRSLVEAPMTVIRLPLKSLPVGGGGYLRHFPLAFTRWALRRAARARPVIVYVHPCEIQTSPDPIDMSVLPADTRRNFQRFHRLQLRNRHTVESKLDRLLDLFAFVPLVEVIDARLGEAWRA
ncbi:MAG TPA: DUF3473 domain-containing protein [Phycisphaerae bacterium]|nr:DUF3473 domain-containing protein [Phycisphaerae bacterium]